MSRLKWLLSGVPCLVLIASHSPAAVAQASDAILWLDAEHSEPYVIPESAFAELDWSDPDKADLSSLPFTDEQADSLRSMVAAKASRLAAEDCRSYPNSIGDSFGYGPQPGSRTLLGLVQEAKIAAVGRVSRLVPMWDPMLRRPNTLVVLQLEEFAVGVDPAFRVGHEFSYLLPYGRIFFGSVEECFLPAEECLLPTAEGCLTYVSSVYIPQIGDRVLLLGYPDPVNPGNLFGVSHFPVRDGVVVPGNHIALRDRSPVPWSQLRAALCRTPTWAEM